MPLGLNLKDWMATKTPSLKEKKLSAFAPLWLNFKDCRPRSH